MFTISFLFSLRTEVELMFLVRNMRFSKISFVTRFYLDSWLSTAKHCHVGDVHHDFTKLASIKGG